MRITIDELEKMVDEFSEKHMDSSHIYVVMRWGYTEKEMLNSHYRVELLMYDDCDVFERVWESD